MPRKNTLLINIVFHFTYVFSCAGLCVWPPQPPCHYVHGYGSTCCHKLRRPYRLGSDGSVLWLLWGVHGLHWWLGRSGHTEDPGHGLHQVDMDCCYSLRNAWWRDQIEPFVALLALCAGNSPVTGEFPSQRPLMQSFDVFFDLRLNKRLSTQSWGWWFQKPLCPLWRHCNVDISSKVSKCGDGTIRPINRYEVLEVVRQQNYEDACPISEQF